MAEETNQKKETKDKRKGIDIDIGGGLNTIFGGINSLLDFASNIADQVKKIEDEGGTKSHTGTFKTKSGATGVYGFNVRVGIGGEPVVSKFGNITHTDDGPVVEEVREPLVDTFDEKNEVLLVVEIPGADEDKIKVELEGDILNISAEGKDRKYAKEILLKSEVQKEGMKHTFKNGVLEIHLPKKKN